MSIPLHGNPWLARARCAIALGVVPIIRRNVLVKCAPSEKPARCAVSVIFNPPASSRHASCRRSHRMYGRRGVPTDSVNACIRRDRESPAMLANLRKDKSSETPIEALSSAMRVRRVLAHASCKISPNPPSQNVLRTGYGQLFPSRVRTAAMRITIPPFVRMHTKSSSI